jgi:hypothetical protein
MVGAMYVWYIAQAERGFDDALVRLSEVRPSVTARHRCSEIAHSRADGSAAGHHLVETLGFADAHAAAAHRVNRVEAPARPTERARGTGAAVESYAPG